MNLHRFINCGVLWLSLGVASLWPSNSKVEEGSVLTSAGQRIEAHYIKQLEDLRARLTK